MSNEDVELGVVVPIPTWAYDFEGQKPKKNIPKKYKWAFINLNV
jgi:hypothetical protein